MLLDIAKESADSLPPLKSCLGGINAVIKHYEVRFCRLLHHPTDGSIPPRKAKMLKTNLGTSYRG